MIIETLQKLTTDHAKLASIDFHFIIIKTPDTDVFLICLAQQHELSADLNVATSTSRSSCLIFVRSVAEKY